MDLLSQYKNYIRPTIAKLLDMLKLDKNYFQGSGDTLKYKNAEGKIIEVLDLVGGYGANLLGHNNSEISSIVLDSVTSEPNNVQGSLREASAQLGVKFSELLEKETNQTYICHLSNSGTEAVEAALKIAALRGYERRVQYRQNNLQALNILRTIDPKELEKINTNLLKKLKLKKASELIDFVIGHNKNIFKKSFTYLAIEGSYHGKTLGSLNVTYQDTYKEKFLQNKNCIFVKRNNIDDLKEKIKSAEREFYYFDEITNKLTLKKLSFLIGIIAEPIQGEAGIYELDKSFLKALRKTADSTGSILIFDEIQCGLYRTGTLSAASPLNIVADVYTFSKSLGGGYSKIAATLINNNSYYPQFGVLHTSTFAEDGLSSKIALRALEILSNENNIKRATFAANSLIEKLSLLQKEFSNILSPIRGKGLMLGVEIKEECLNNFYEFKLYSDIGLIGHLFSSALLNNENIRISPTLSNTKTLRIEPSIYFSNTQIDFALKGLRNLLIQFQNKNMSYFFSNLADGIKIDEATPVKANFKRKNTECAVFLNHLIHTDDARKVFGAFKHFDDKTLEKFMTAFAEISEFNIYDIQELEYTNGKKIDVIFMGFPVSTKILFGFMKARMSNFINAKIQQAINRSINMGATTVGLGQFTSIVSKNGLVLDSHGINLTTGNAYTVALGVEGALKLCKEKLGKSKDLNITCIGAAGNIISVATAILADNASKINLIYHTELNKSLKMQIAFKRIIQEIIKSNSKNTLVSKIKKIVTKNSDIISLYNKNKFKGLIEISTDLNTLKESDLIFSGTNSQKAIITNEFISDNTVIVDVGVPSNIDPNINKKNVFINHGGLAKLPTKFHYHNPSYPLKRGQSFACAAETMALSINGSKNILHIGDLTREKVQSSVKYAKKAGIELGDLKDSNLF